MFLWGSLHTWVHVYLQRKIRRERNSGMFILRAHIKDEYNVASTPTHPVCVKVVGDRVPQSLKKGKGKK